MEPVINSVKLGNIIVRKTEAGFTLTGVGGFVEVTHEMISSLTRVLAGWPGMGAPSGAEEE